MKTAGLDYSVTSPGLCIDGVYHYWHKDPISYKVFKGHYYPMWKTQTERVYKIATSMMKYMDGVDLVIIEDYSFGANGRITELAEGLGIFKGMLYNAGIGYETVAPSTLKKFATGSGRAKKPDMVAQFIEDTGYDIFKIFDKKSTLKTIPAPLTDIADSYFLSKYIKKPVDH